MDDESFVGRREHALLLPPAHETDRRLDGGADQTGELAAGERDRNRERSILELVTKARREMDVSCTVVKAATVDDGNTRCPSSSPARKYMRANRAKSRPVEKSPA